MKVLITGANGQLGSELRRDLASGRTELGEIPTALKSAQVVGVDVAELDITDGPAVQQYLQNNPVDVIINCAAMTNVDGCEKELEVAFKVNALGARNLAIAAEAIGAKLIHVSTDYVFAGDGFSPYIEWDLVNPKSIYGKSKALGEQYVQTFCSRYFIVRTAWLYGYEGNNFVKTIMRVARKNGSIKVVDDQLGNPTNAVDLAHHLLKLAATEQYGIYHCTGTGICSWYDFASKIVELAGIDCQVNACTTEEYGSPTRRPAYSALDNMALRCTVGDEMRPWEEALTCFFENYTESEKA